MNTKNKEDASEDIELLLPWHAAGTLSRRDAARVEQALANDNELASRYELVREELGEAIRLNEIARCAVGARDAEPVRQDRRRAGAHAAHLVQCRRLVHRFRIELPAAHAWLMPRAPPRIAIVLQAGILAGFVMQDSQGGPTLASHGTPQNGTGAYVLIRFNPQASVSRHQQVPGRAQGLDRRRSGGRQRPVPPQGRGKAGRPGRARRHRQADAGQSGGRLHGPCRAVNPRRRKYGALLLFDIETRSPAWRLPCDCIDALISHADCPLRRSPQCSPSQPPETPRRSAAAVSVSAALA